MALKRWGKGMSDSDRAYYRRRLAEERAQAQRVDNDDVRAFHCKLAKMYRQRLDMLGPQIPVSE